MFDQLFVVGIDDFFFFYNCLYKFNCVIIFYCCVGCGIMVIDLKKYEIMVNIQVVFFLGVVISFDEKSDDFWVFFFVLYIEMFCEVCICFEFFFFYFIKEKFCYIFFFEFIVFINGFLYVMFVIYVDIDYCFCNQIVCNYL